MDRNKSENVAEKRKTADEQASEIEGPNLRGDYKNLAMMLLLYMLQGIPQGISLAVPILLQNRGVSYAQQSEFSIAYFPIALKLLWAPIVDSKFIKSFGRRKTWICSSQILMGIFMIYLSFYADRWLGDGENAPQITILTAGFFALLLITSIQDIAVDGWSLTMLKRRNIGYIGTTNSVGFSTGRFIGFIILLLLESKEFGNDYIFSEPRDKGLVTLSGFIMFWGCVYIVVTILIGIFKHEYVDNAEQLKEHCNYGIVKVYMVLLKVLRLRPVFELCLLVFSIEAAFAAFEAATSLKLIEYGVPKEKFAMLTIPSVPVQIIVPLLITKYTAGRKPLSFFYKLFIIRLILMIIITFYILITPKMLENANFVVYFYVGAVILFIVDQSIMRATYTCDGSFFPRIADPIVGASYMTFLTTFGNFSERLFVTICLWLLDLITWKKCEFDEFDVNFNSTLVPSNFTGNTCSNNDEKITCEKYGGSCVIKVDGFYIEIAISVVYGIIWCKVFKPVIYRLQRYPVDDFHVYKNPNDSKAIEEATGE